MLSRRTTLLGMLAFSIAEVAKAGEAGRLYAQSRGYDQNQKDWLNEQKIPGMTTRCCNEADGEEVQEDVRENNYWIKGSKFPDWTLVPQNAVLDTPNKIGQPVVWWYEDRNEGRGVFKIKCYAPGAKL